MYIADSTPATENFLHGFLLACIMLLHDERLLIQTYIADVAREMGWNVGTVPLHEEMKARGYSDVQIRDALLTIHLTAWQRAAEHLSTNANATITEGT
jgi:hypothetical protein